MPNDRPPPQGNRGQSAGLAPPSTPRKDGAELGALIRSLEQRWQLGLPIRDETWSPLKSKKDLPNRVYNQLKHCYWKGNFHEAVGRFVLRAKPPVVSDTHSGRTARLTLLHEIIQEMDQEHGRASGSRAGTPLSARKRLNADSQMLKPEQTSASGSRPSAPSSGLYYSPRSNNDEAFNATAPDLGSSTDEDEPPPSPIASSKSAQWHVEASPQFQMGSTATKRPSNSSGSGSPPKLTRTLMGKQSSYRLADSGQAKPAPAFKRPSLPKHQLHQPNRSLNAMAYTTSFPPQRQPEMGGSFQSSSVNTSFNTISSSQQTQADTANTSFASDNYDSDIRYPTLTRTSSTTLGSLDDQELLCVQDPVEAQLRREIAEWEELGRSLQDPPHEIASTYGSVDEEVMLERSFTVEVEEGYKLPAQPKELPPKPEKARRGQPSANKANSERGSFTELSPFNRPAQTKRTDEMSLLGNVTSGQPPVKAVPRSTSTSSQTSPSKLPYYIRDITVQNLFTEPITEELNKFPYFVLFICSRLASERGMPLSMLLQGIDASSVLTNASQFLEHVCTNLNTSSDVLRDQQKYWSASKRGFEGYTFKARIDFKNPNSMYSSTPVFDLKILPIQAEWSCRFQRKFGSDRFLYVNVPSLEMGEKPRRFSNDYMKKIKDQFKLWCQREHSFLGRKWKVFHMESIKKKKKRVTDDMSKTRIIMFATEGNGIVEPMTVGNMLDWFFPFGENMQQTYLKAFARWDLGLSRTIPTLTFKPSQVLYVKDTIADGIPEDTQFDDNTIGSWPHEYRRDIIMNDGCSLISAGAALLIWQAVKKVTNSDEPMPSAFQGRIGGAKGVWMISGEPSILDVNEQDIWIEISESQRKFEPAKEDLSDDLPWDPHRLTFEYLKHSHRPIPSELHISFIPILVDRGVPKDVIAGLMVKQLDIERKELIELLPTTERMYHWVHKEAPSNLGFEIPRWQAAMYQSLPEQIKHLYESGFLPEREPYLADCLYRFIKRRKLWMESKLRVPLSKSTFVIGVADPFQVLEPGQVHMEFSTPFTDELTGSRFRSLNNMDILVSRQPACRRSDIQKVRAVKHPELSHIIDVVVFSSKGKYPLAGKLQGGDHDGDIFWLCWDEAIVKPFKNAPAPIESPDPKLYRIEQDKRKLFEVMDPNDLSTVDDFLKEAVEFRMTPSLLGIVTNSLEKEAYDENQVYSDRLDKCCDIHDLLVDAAKQGYKLTEQDWRNLKIEILGCENRKEPAYKEAMKDCEKKDTDEADKTQNKSYNHKQENILDYLYFEIVRNHDVATLKQVKDFFPKAFGNDPDPVLQYPFQHLRSHGSEIIKEELDTLVESLKAVERKWLDFTNAPNKETRLNWYNEAVETCYEKYRSILPTQVDHPDIKPWVYPYQRPQYSVWEEIRASTFYSVFKERHKLVWIVAGKQLAELKAASYLGSTTVAPRIKAIMRPKAPRVLEPEDDESDDDFQDALEE